MLRDLLVAPIGLAGRVRDVVALDVHNSRTRGEIFSFLVSDVGVPDIVEVANFTAIECGARAGERSRGLRLEIFRIAFRVIPSSEDVSFRDVRVELHATRANHGKRTAYVLVSYCDSNKREDVLPPNSPTLTLFQAMIGSPLDSKFSACLPHSVSRTDALERSTMVSSRFFTYARY